MNRTVQLLIAVILTGLLGPFEATASEIMVAFWNVENLFDTDDDPKVDGDEEFTPGGPKNWTSERLEIKLKNLTRVIRQMNGGKGPELLGLCEIENRAVLELLVKSLAPLGRDYRIIHQDSPSNRGIDCALIYDRKVVDLSGSPRFHEVKDGHTRDIVEAKVNWGGSHFTVMVNHWPSLLNPEAARIQVAKMLRHRVDELLSKNPAEDILLIGDFNEFPDGEALTKYLRTGEDAKSLKPGVILNSMWPLHAEQKSGTYVYNNKWNVLDQVLLTSGMLDEAGVSWVANSSHPMKEDYMLYTPRTKDPVSRPSRSYTGQKFHPDGYSDHLPILCRIRK